MGWSSGVASMRVLRNVPHRGVWIFFVFLCKLPYKLKKIEKCRPGSMQISKVSPLTLNPGDATGLECDVLLGMGEKSEVEVNIIAGDINIDFNVYDQVRSTSKFVDELI